MIRPLFHAWERRLASVDTNRFVRPFEWGLDWIELDPSAPDPRTAALSWAQQTTAASDRFFTAPTLEAGSYERRGDELRFPSAVVTPSDPNNTVVVRVIEARVRRPDQPRRAVVVLPQWNSDADGHVGLGQLFARFGVTALRLSLPYHDVRRPPELQRADYIVSANIGRTLLANRQAVLDVKRAVDWLVQQGYERIGIIGTSLGSCLAMLAMAHDPRIRAGAFNHVSPYFADVVWRGLSTAHVRAGLEQTVTLDELRQLWMPISPWPFIDRITGRKALLVTARYDLTFPVDLSRTFVREFRHRRIPHQHVTLPCGHYTTGKTPFKFYDGYVLTRFFVKNL